MTGKQGHNAFSGGWGIGAHALVGLLFVALKLTGVIRWSWWWVTAPVWGAYAYAALALVVGLLVMAWRGWP